MNVYYHLIALYMAVIGSGLPFVSQAQDHEHGQGIMTFDQRYHYFGALPEGPSVRYTYLFKNTGTEPIQIERVETTCGCTTPYYTKNEIRPGETDSIVAEFATEGRLGPFYKKVIVHTNTYRDVQILSFAGTVINEVPTNNSTLVLESSELKLGVLQAGKTTTRSIAIKNTGTDALSITGIHSPCACIRLVDPISLPPGSSTGASVAVFIREDSQGGTYPVHFVSSAPDISSDSLSLSFRLAPPTVYPTPQRSNNPFGW